MFSTLYIIFSVYARPNQVGFVDISYTQGLGLGLYLFYYSCLFFFIVPSYSSYLSRFELALTWRQRLIGPSACGRALAPIHTYIHIIIYSFPPYYQYSINTRPIILFRYTSSPLHNTSNSNSFLTIALSKLQPPEQQLIDLISNFNTKSRLT